MWRRTPGLGLGVAVEQSSPDVLQLAADGQLARVEVDVVPGESQRLALAQTDDEDQGVGGVERRLWVCTDPAEDALVGLLTSTMRRCGRCSGRSLSS